MIALSKLENDKKTGKLNLDFLKRGKNKNSPRGENATETPTNQTNTMNQAAPVTNSIIPPATTTATYVIKGGPGTNDPKLPPPAMVTAVVRTVPVPELGKASANIIGTMPILPQPGSLTPMNNGPEEIKMSPRLMASPSKGALSLAPLNTKSKATLQPLTLPQSTKVANNPDSKLSQIPNIESENETEFESAKTLMPKDSN